MTAGQRLAPVQRIPRFVPPVHTAVCVGQWCGNRKPPTGARAPRHTAVSWAPVTPGAMPGASHGANSPYNSWTRSVPHTSAEAELELGPQTADFRAANPNPFLRGTDRGLGLTQLPATCVPTSVSHACSQAASGPGHSGLQFPLYESKCWLSCLVPPRTDWDTLPCHCPSLSPSWRVTTAWLFAWGPLTH